MNTLLVALGILIIAILIYVASVINKLRREVRGCRNLPETQRFLGAQGSEPYRESKRGSRREDAHFAPDSDGMSDVERFIAKQRRERWRESEPGYRREGAHFVVGEARPLRPDFRATADSKLPGE